MKLTLVKEYEGYKLYQDENGYLVDEDGEYYESVSDWIGEIRTYIQATKDL